jgi:alcohol dehydrogenase
MLFSREAFRLTISSYSKVLEEPTDVDARAAMLLGASFAGIAIENSMLGAAHSAANPLTAHFGIVHGHAVGLMLPHVVRFNGREPDANEAYGEIARHAGLIGLHGSLEGNAEAVAEAAVQMAAASGLPMSLAACGVQEKDIPMLAAEAATQWTARFNPREAVAADFEDLYRAAFNPPMS